MSPESILKRAGFAVTSNSIGVPRWGLSNEISHRSQRFRNFQQALFDGAQIGPGTFALHLIAFHGIDPLTIQQLGNTNLVRYSSRHGHTLEFISGGKLVSRVIVCNFTTALELKWTVDMVAAQEWLSTRFNFTGASLNDVLIELRCDQLAWLRTHQPPSIFAHMSGLIPCTSLSHDTWAREHTGLVPPSAVDLEDCALQTSVDLILDQLTVDRNKEDGTTFLTRVVSGLSNQSNEPDKDRRARWIKHLLKFAPQALQYSKATTIVLAWCANTIESGTVKKGNAADLTTRRRYVVALSSTLLSGLQALPENPRHWNSKARAKVFEDVLKSVDGKDFPALSAAVASFQAYLRDEFDVPLVRLSTTGLQPDPQVRAQYVTETEVKRVSEWIQTVFVNDPVFRLRINALLWMCYDAPFRVSEVLALAKNRIRRLGAGTFEIAVYVSEENNLKTDAGARRIWIGDPRAVDALEQLIASRELEGWTSNDLLFAHGMDGSKVHGIAALRRTLLKLLKAATGDESMTIHALRHTWVTRSLLSGLTSSSISAVPLLACKVAQTGHVALHTSMTSYFHLPEVVIRLHLDIALVEELAVTSKTGEPYCNMRAATIRQRVVRGGHSINQTVWAIAMRRAESLVPPPVEASEWIVPSCPRIESRSAAQQTPALLLQFLILVERGAKPSELAPRFGFSEAYANELVLKVTALIEQLEQSKYSRQRKIDARKRAMGGITLAKAMQPKYRKILRWMEEGDFNSQIVKIAVDAWQIIRNRYGYLDMCHQKAADLLRFLKSTGIGIEELGVRAQLGSDANVEHDFVQRSAIAQRAFIAGFGEPLREVQRAPMHPSRCGVFLVWSGQGGSDLRGLDALLLVLSVYFKSVGETK